jgi:CHAT domain-containing protein
MLAERPTKVNGSAALLIACGTFQGRAPALPGVSAELAAVSRHWDGDVVTLRDEQATRAALLNRAREGQLAGYGLLHFATHARMLPAHGLAAHLKLWDGDMLLPEVAGLRLGGALVVLSACEGAAAETLPGEEVLSLSWALVAAGASGVLASLWRIDDSVAQRFAALFYQELCLGHDAGAALACAQRTLIAEDGALGPDAWGCFVLTGPGVLSVSSSI